MTAVNSFIPMSYQVCPLCCQPDEITSPAADTGCGGLGGFFTELAAAFFLEGLVVAFASPSLRSYGGHSRATVDEAEGVDV